VWPPLPHPDMGNLRAPVELIQESRRV
jgi:hypothetical protein